MRHRKLITVALFLTGAWLAGRCHAAELAGLSTLAAPGSCSPAAATVSAPAPFLSQESAAITPATNVCRCGDAACIGKTVNSHCSPIRFCLALSVCSTSPGMRCGCDAPP